MIYGINPLLRFCGRIAEEAEMEIRREGLQCRKIHRGI